MDEQNTFSKAIEVLEKAGHPLTNEQKRYLNAYTETVKNISPVPFDLTSDLKKIEEILTKSNLGGLVGLFSKTKGVSMHLFPTWSLLQRKKDTDNMIFKCDRSSFKNKNDFHNAIQNTLRMLSTMCDVSNYFAETCKTNYVNVCDAVVAKD